MDNTLEGFKKEITGLEETRKKFEHTLIKAQTQYDAAVKTLQDKFNISPDEVATVIEMKKNKLIELKERLRGDIDKAKAYIEKIGKVLDNA